MAAAAVPGSLNAVESDAAFEQTPSGQMRRKSVLPVDPAVMRDLEAHRSFEAAQAAAAHASS